MICHRCGTEFPPPPTSHEPRLHCRNCGARLFAWLGDHFGTRDTVVALPARQERGGIDANALILLIIAVLVLTGCVCLSALIH